MADAILLGRRQLRDGPTVLRPVRDEDRVVAEAAGPAGLEDERTLAHAFRPHLAAIGPRARRNASVPGRAFAVPDRPDAVDEALEVRLVGGAVAGEPGGARARSA